MLTLLIAGALFSACTSEHDKAANSPLDDNSPHTLSLIDTSVRNMPCVQLTTRNQSGDYTIAWGNEDCSWSGDLMAMTGQQGYRMPPTLLWTNDRFICLMTDHTGPFSQHLFLPLSDELGYRFYQDDIEYMDTVDNFVAFIRSEEPDRITWTVESLLTGLRESFEMKICEKEVVYPWYSAVYRHESELIIESDCLPAGRRVIDLSRYLRQAIQE
jgi:hypothetical protein